MNYEQGTVDHPPRNAPKPKVTDALSANTVTGFHEAIAYFAAAMDYLVKTGSTDAFSTGIQLSSKTRSEVDALSASILAGVEKGSWYVNPSASYALSSAQPSIMSDGNLLFKGRYTLDFGTEAVAEGKIQPVVASASASAEPTEPSEDALVSDAASPTASASASATAAGPASQVTVQECDFRGRYHAAWRTVPLFREVPPREAHPPRVLRRLARHPVRLLLLPPLLLKLPLRRPPLPRRHSSS